MNTLEHRLHQLNILESSPFPADSPLWQAFIEQNSALFERAQADKDDNNVLLGLLTKAHIEAMAMVENQGQSAAHVFDAIKQNLGDEHQDKFELHSEQQLVLITHAWIYLQGYLALDFSLANDHARHTAQILTQHFSGDLEVRRSNFMQSYYLGKQNTSQQRSWLQRIFAWFKD